jgi:hypothetical protein
VVGSRLALAASFHQSRFDQSLQHGAGVRIGFLRQLGGLRGGQVALLPQGIQQEQFVQP